MLKIYDTFSEKEMIFEDIKEFIENFYSENDYEEDCENFQTEEEKIACFGGYFGEQSIEKVDEFWNNYTGAVEMWLNTYKQEVYRNSKTNFGWFHYSIQTIE